MIGMCNVIAFGRWAQVSTLHRLHAVALVRLPVIGSKRKREHFTLCGCFPHQMNGLPNMNSCYLALHEANILQEKGKQKDKKNTPVSGRTAGRGSAWRQTDTNQFKISSCAAV